MKSILILLALFSATAQAENVSKWYTVYQQDKMRIDVDMNIPAVKDSEYVVFGFRTVLDEGKPRELYYVANFKMADCRKPVIAYVERNVMSQKKVQREAEEGRVNYTMLQKICSEVYVPPAKMI